ncbi:uncharacterized protein LOC104908938 isoform X2 [Beta vulgaris subsp. vulgaris]|uniref:uncharacterized protein LOC104908938 isoform X2 n=1 Tax=Beta vulgaris subsp. vulgaris TaxID=3555 RepID=UPI00054034F7|nr:uncharacterized protein LOC104908938 isoform X2 [Beta vulgaris subsp. vulgaris]
MPPRRRKVGLKRMDAAIDALTPMGFPPEKIRQKVKDLLELYEDDHGWIAIEEASYKLLIECILEEQEQEQEQEGVQCKQGEPSFIDSPNKASRLGGEDGEAEPSEVGPSSEASEPLCSNQDTALATPITDAPSPSPLAVLTPTSSPAGNLTSASITATIDVANRENGFAVRKRNPCLGWIGPANDEDFILLKPATVLGRRTGDRPRKRKSRWDVGPNDVV